MRHDDQTYSLAELGDITRVEPRTLRSWIQAGLLLPPVKGGRGATYPSANRDRALAVSALKHHGHSLDEISRLFLSATAEQIEAWAEEAAPPRGSVREYLGQVRAAAKTAPEPSFRTMERRVPGKDPYGDPASGSRRGRMEDDGRLDDLLPRRRVGDVAAVEQLLVTLEQVLGNRRSKPMKGEHWIRIPVTRDFEFSIRGEFSSKERYLFEQIAGQFRNILMRGINND